MEARLSLTQGGGQHWLHQEDGRDTMPEPKHRAEEVAPLHICVVTPTYHRSGYLRRTLASLKDQTYPHFTATICDNASEAAAQAVVEELHDDRFSYLPRPENLGMFHNAMDGFQRATGDLVFKLDDDDLLEPDFFETLVKPFTERDDVTVAFSEIVMIDADDEVLPVQTDAMADVNQRASLAEGYHRPFTSLAARGSIQLGAALMRRTAIDWNAIPEEVATAYDLFLLLQAARDGSAAYYCPRPLFRYRLHPGSDSANHLMAQLAGASHGLETELLGGRHTDHDTLEYVLYDAKVRRSRELLRAGKVEEARQDLRRALQLRRGVSPARLLALTYVPGSIRERILIARKAGSVDPTRLGAHDG